MLIAKNEVLIKSQFIQIVKGKDKAIIWHSLFGNPKIVSKETLDFLDLFSKPHQLCSVLEKYYFEENVEESIQDLIENYYLVQKILMRENFLRNIWRVAKSPLLTDHLSTTLNSLCRRCAILDVHTVFTLIILKCLIG